MKKIIILIMTGTLALGACSRIELGEYNGSFNQWDRPYKAGEEYMVELVKNLLPDCLIALENSLMYDRYGYYYESTSEYQTQGKSLRVVGTEWTVKAYSPVKKIKIKCLSETSWKMEYNGDYTIVGFEYPTSITVEAVLNNTTTEEDDTSTGENTLAGHNNWIISFNGNRTERDGYACSFESNPTIQYNTAGNSYGWNRCVGSAYMDVTKNGQKVDRCRTEYLGNDTRYYRGI